MVKGSRIVWHLMVLGGPAASAAPGGCEKRTTLGSPRRLSQFSFLQDSQMILCT